MDNIVDNIKKALITVALRKYNKERDNIIKLFAEKHGIEYEYCSGHVYCFGDYFFNLDDIIYDLENNCPKDLILQWQQDTTDYNSKHEADVPTYISFNSYNMGMRYENLNK